MKMPFQELLKNIVRYGTGDLFIKASVFLTIPIYTRIFNPDDYGILNYVLSTVGLFGVIISLGADSAFTRFFWGAKTLEERQVVASTWFGFLAVWSGGIVILCLPFAKLVSQWSFGTENYAFLFVCALLTAPFTLINNLCGQVLRNQNRAWLFSILSVASTLLGIGLSLFGVLILHLGLLGILGGSLLGACIMLPIRLWTARRLLRPLFSGRVLSGMLSWGVPLVPTSLAYWVFGMSDRLLLGKLSSLDQVGLYAVASGVSSILILVNGAIGLAWVPIAFRIYEEQREVAAQFFGQVMTYILLMFGLLSVGVTTFAFEALTILSTPAFYTASIAVGPLALGFMASASTQVTTLGISLTKKTKYFAVLSWLAALLNLVLNLIFIPRWGMIAASWTTALSYSFLSLAYLFISQRLSPVVYEKRRVFVTIVVTIGFVVGARFFPEMTPMSRIIAKSLYCMTYLGTLFLFKAADKREWVGLSSILRGRLAFAGISE
ncbi:MAG: oligosaccharide flippase family protein [candidate division Zixibacteria bacterium]|nr:oligosaccharide flippase family protein [candidate division Zixibacteria bacterium]